MIMGGSSLFSEFLLIAIILLYFPDINTCETCFPNDRQALIDFKKDLKDPSNRLWTWIHDTDCCKWEGVVCSNRSGRVIQLRLQNPGRIIDYFGYEEIDLKSAFSGNINHSLLSLTQLHHLDLSLNDFKGIQIPTFLGSLKSLRYLNLSQAGFQGMVPYQLGNLSSLHTLSVGEIWPRLQVHNLQWLASLSNLVYLDMSNVDLSIASNWVEVINMIPSLVQLHLAFCDLIKISQLVYTNFSSLSVLDLSGNNFGHFIPRWIFGLTALVSLDLSGNLFNVPWPRGPWNLTSLHHLDLSWNNLDGSLPSEFFNLNNLVSLNLATNQIFEGSFPDGIWNWSSLTSLDLSNNTFSMYLPSLLSPLTALISVDLSFNLFQGYIPGSIANISNLQYLDLSYNNLSSALPSELFTLKDLIALDVTSNHFNGPIPITVGNCTKLRNLCVSDNSLTLSTLLFNCTSLESLELRGINLSGSIPSNLGKLPFLKSLVMSENKLTGTLPESLGQLSNLEGLFIFNNLLEGIVSESLLDNLTSVRFFDASGNSLTLNVSASWNPRPQFTALGLGSWKLGPQFPTWLQSQKNILSLNLSSAGISDNIPPWSFNLVMQYADLSHNQLHGGISHFLCEVENGKAGLILLDLGDNSLSGEIPDCWMNYPMMEYINLNNNNFNGSIPRSLVNLEDLYHLGLANNSLTGLIPPIL